MSRVPPSERGSQFEANSRLRTRQRGDGVHRAFAEACGDGRDAHKAQGSSGAPEPRDGEGVRVPG